MAQIGFVVALSLIAGASPMAGSYPEPVRAQAAPAGTPDTRYCMRVEAFTGSRIEVVKCWTRQEWAEQGVDVDEEWAEEGVRVIT